MPRTIVQRPICTPRPSTEDAHLAHLPLAGGIGLDYCRGELNHGQVQLLETKLTPLYLQMAA